MALFIGSQIPAAQQYLEPSGGGRRNPQKRRGVGALPIDGIQLDQLCRLRAGHLMTLYRVGRSTLYVHIELGYIPKPDGKDNGRPYWNSLSIKADLLSQSK